MSAEPLRPLIQPYLPIPADAEPVEVRRRVQIKRSAAPSNRRKHAVESFQNAATTIGSIDRGMSLFAITRGQFSMIDALLHVLDQVGRAEVSLWTWVIAEYEIQCMERLMRDERITTGRLIIDIGARTKSPGVLDQWRATFGPDSIRHVITHAKIATVTAEDGRRVLLRGSMNLNFNPRFEQLDITEGGEDYDLVRELEDELEREPCASSHTEARVTSRTGDAFNAETIALFGDGLKVWSK